MRGIRGLLAAAAAVIAVAACSTSSGTDVKHGSAPAVNAIACQHFKVQGDKFKGLATPSLGDVAQAIARVQEDAAMATDPKLRRDFRHWVADAKKLMDGQQPAGNPKTPIVADCARFGVTVPSS